MAQFDVHILPDGTMVINLQSDLLSGYPTTLVAPLLPEDELPVGRSRMHPMFQIDGQRLLLAPQLVSAVPSRSLGRVTASLGDHDYVIKGALDMVLSGY
jgi:toxin CcdB